MNTTTKRLINTALATTAVLAGLSVAPAASATNATVSCATAAEFARVTGGQPVTRSEAHRIIGNIGEMQTTITHRGRVPEGYYNFTIQRRAYRNCAAGHGRYFVRYVRQNTAGPNRGIFIALPSHME